MEYAKNSGTEILEQYRQQLASDEKKSLESLEPGKTVLVIVDMVNGFVREGALSSPNAETIVPGIAGLMQACTKRGYRQIFFADCHTPDSPEFSAYPVHCVEGTAECEPVKELAELGEYQLIRKNSTNGSQEPEFREWLTASPEIENFVIVGCCTDICVQQFALGVKTECNRRNRPSKVIVVADLCSTYDAPGHESGAVELMSFYNMQTNGVEVTPGIVF